ncbi:MAG: RAD55 family ATPase [Methanosarcina sp.]|jgi:archaeal flagellar protein FlaH|uniref:RAD55 family ATPase n=1 Tax=Methanosarcina sp. TaxID=2213 RepID=UPI003BB81599
MERIASGIEYLDLLLGGGYPKGKGILITGPTGSGKTIMGIHFLYSNCSAGKRGLLILTRTLLEDLILQSKALGMDLEPFIDSNLLLIENVFQSRLQETLFASRLGKGLEVAEKDRVGRVNELSKNMDVVVLDSLGALTKTQSCVGNEALSKFDAIYSILAKHGCTSLILMDERAHKQHQGFADYLVFGKIELKFKEDPANGKFVRHISVVKMRAMNMPEENLSFEIVPSGIKIK